MADITLTWQMKDDKACKKCKELNGESWTFQLGEGPLPPTFDSGGNAVWDVASGSLKHENCRCDIALTNANLKDLIATVNAIIDQVTTSKGAV